MSYLALGTWINGELGISIICTSATTLKPLLTKMRVVHSSRGERTYDSHSQFQQTRNHQAGMDEVACLRVEPGAEDVSLHAYAVLGDQKTTEAISVV